MKQCISRIKNFFIHLWQTLRKYVCKRKPEIKFQDIDADGFDEIIVDFNGSNVLDPAIGHSSKENNKEKEE